MGIIQKQAIRSTALTYIGVLVAFVVRTIIFPRALDPDQIGLLDILVAYSTLFAQLASFGFSSATTRLFPYFRDKEKGHNGFLFIALAITVIGFILAVVVFLFMVPGFVESKGDKSPLFVEYLYYIVPLILFSLLFNTLDNYNKVLFNVVRGTMLKEFISRLLVFASIVLYIFRVVDFQVFVLLYVAAMSLPSIIFMVLLIREKQFNVKPNFGFLTKSMIKTMASMCFFGIIISATGIVTLNIDRIMIEDMLGLGQTGIYTTAFFFGTLIILPSRSLVKISSTFIADAWKDNDLPKINQIYYKTCINQFVIGVILTVGIWVNIDNIFIIMTDKFSEGKYVILFIALAYLSDMLSGVSASIIGNSKHYRMQALFMAIMVVLIVVTNYIFIPIYGIVGAAFASFLAKMAVNLMRFVYVWYKFKMQPYDYKTLIAAGAGLLAFGVGFIIPDPGNFIADIAIRSIAVTVVFIPLVLVFKLSEEMNNQFERMLQIAGIRKKN